MSQVQTVKTLIHEMAHQKLHSIDPKELPPEEPRLTRNAKEVEAESVAYTVAQHYGIETSDYSFAYIAGWSQGKDTPELKASLDRIRQAANEMITAIDDHIFYLENEKNIEVISFAPKEPVPGLQENGLYRYYSTQRPVDIGTFPKPADNKPVEIHNYDSRIPVEDGSMLAWGYLEYAKPLTEKQASDYELRPAPAAIEAPQKAENSPIEVSKADGRTSVLKELAERKTASQGKNSHKKEDKVTHKETSKVTHEKADKDPHKKAHKKKEETR